MSISSLEMLESLSKETHQKVVKSQEATSRHHEIQQEISKIQTLFERDLEAEEARELEERLKILQSTIESARKDGEQTTQDFAEVVANLKLASVKIEGEIGELGKPTEEDLVNVRRVEKTLARYEKQLEIDKQRLLIAEAATGFSTWFGRKTRAIHSANLEISNTNENINRTKSDLETANEEAKEIARQRLMNADMEQSLENFEVHVEAVIDAGMKNVEDIEKVIEEVTAGKKEALNVLGKAASAIDKYTAEISEMEEKVKSAEQELGMYENATAEWAAANERLSGLNSQLEKLRGKKNIAVSLYMSKENFSKSLEIDEMSQQKLHDALLALITNLQSDMESRRVTYRSLLRAMKSSDTLDHAILTSDIGKEQDRRNTQAVAQFGAAAERAILMQHQQHEARIKEIQNIAESMAEAKADVLRQEKVLFEQLAEKWGIDLSKSRVNYYMDKEPEQKIPAKVEPAPKVSESKSGKSALEIAGL